VIIGGDGTSGDLTTEARLKVIGTDSIMIPSGSNAQRPAAPEQGMLRYNSTVGSAEIYTGAEWKNLAGDFTLITADSFSGDNSTVAFTLSQDATTAGVVVSINGVVQLPTSAYSVSSTTLTFTEAPATGDVIDVRILVTTSSLSGVASGNGVMKLEPVNGAINIYTGTSAGTITSYWNTDGALVENKAGVVIAAGAPSTLVTIDGNAIRSAKLVVQSTNGTDYEVAELLVIHDGTTATVTVYGQTATNGEFMEYSATMSGSNVLVQAEPASGSATVRVAKQYIAV